MQETKEMKVWSLGWEDPLEEGMATHSSILVWKIPWTEEFSGLQSIGSHKVRHDWSDLAGMQANIILLTVKQWFDLFTYGFYL